MPVKNAPLPTKNGAVTVPIELTNPREYKLPPVIVLVVVKLPVTVALLLVTTIELAVPLTLNNTFPLMFENCTLLFPLAISVTETLPICATWFQIWLLPSKLAKQ